jgi:hypothetical protein
MCNAVRCCTLSRVTAQQRPSRRRQSTPITERYIRPCSEYPGFFFHVTDQSNARLLHLLVGRQPWTRYRSSIIQETVRPPDRRISCGIRRAYGGNAAVSRHVTRVVMCASRLYDDTSPKELKNSFRRLTACRRLVLICGPHNSRLT